MNFPAMTPAANGNQKNHPKLAKAFSILAEKKIPWPQRAPWAFELLWSLGIPVRPPLFYPLALNFVIQIVLFSLMYWLAFVPIEIAVLSYVAWIAGEGSQAFHALLPIVLVVGTKFSIAWGSIVGAVVAITLFYQKKKHGIPDWKNL
jgi:Family of unknown function (DUF6404)